MVLFVCSALLCLDFSLPSCCMISPQLNLIHSQITNLAAFDVEGVINPTNADFDLKDDLGERLQLPLRLVFIHML